jgi:hypothetical protein
MPVLLPWAEMAFSFEHHLLLQKSEVKKFVHKIYHILDE